MEIIKNFLISRGYPYYEIDSAINIIATPKRELKTEHKMGIVAAVMIILILSISSVFYYKLVVEIQPIPQKLLDVETEKITTIPEKGGDLIFQVNLVNFGNLIMYDILLKYSIIDKSTNQVITEKDETVAISTTLQKVGKLIIPKDIDPGSYILRVDAIYNNFTATSGFIFEIVEEGVAQKIIDDVKKKYPVNITNETTQNKTVQNVTKKEIIKKEVSEDKLKPKKFAKGTNIPIRIVEKKKTSFDGMTRSQAIELAKMISIREPDRAISMCNEFEIESNVYSCILEVSKYKKDGSYCSKIKTTSFRDSCYMQMVIETKDEKTCEGIADTTIKTSCESIALMGSLQQNMLQKKPGDPYKTAEKMGLMVTPLTNNTIKN